MTGFYMGSRGKRRAKKVCSRNRAWLSFLDIVFVALYVLKFLLTGWVLVPVISTAVVILYLQMVALLAPI